MADDSTTHWPKNRRAIQPERMDALTAQKVRPVFFPAFTFAHLALCAAAIFLSAAAESVRFRRIRTTLADSRNFAHRARWAGAIRARADLDSFRVPAPLDDLTKRRLFGFSENLCAP
jgi:hypothetical protein